MKQSFRQPNAVDYGIDISGVKCPFCDGADTVRFENITGGAANELLMRCTACRSFFFVMKDPAFLR